MIVYEWGTWYRICLNYNHCGKAEKKPHKMQFLRTQHPYDFLLAGDVGDLVEHEVNDATDDVPKIVPQIHDLGGGFPCTSRTSLSRARADNVKK